jgi:hypothetical protein
MITKEKVRIKEKNEGMEDYLKELLEAKMEQAEIRFKSSRYWRFEKK